MDDARKWKMGLVIVFFLFIIVFAFYRSADLIFGVKIRDTNLVDGGAMPESTTVVSGNARNALHLYLNGREISIDLEGNFRETIALFPGYNIVSIRAVDKFGYEDERIFRLVGTFAETEVRQDSSPLTEDQEL